VRAAKNRAREAEAARIRAETELEIYKRGQQQFQPPADPVALEEEAKLRDPNTTPLEKWQIQSNRTIRETNQNAARAYAAALDTGDRTNFNLECSTDRRLASVKGEVEQRIADMRSRGQQVPPRMAVATFILGEKLLKAQQKPKQQPGAGVDRGRPTNVRSDVRSTGARGKSSQLRARLENVQI
jgi:hypothetical protein